MKYNIAVATVARSDFGIIRPLLREMLADPRVNPLLLVSGMHFSAAHGNTVDLIKSEGFDIAARIPSIETTTSPSGVCAAIAQGVIGFCNALKELQPDLLVVTGDRFDMFPAALSALPLGIPVAHIHGGELTFGAIDDALRHCMTKLSHLHLCAAEAYAKRLQQLGEEPWRISVCGSLSLHNMKLMELPSATDIERELSISLSPPPLLVTIHPETTKSGSTKQLVNAVMTALHYLGLPVIFTLPNADPGYDIITSAIQEFVSSHTNATLVENMNTAAYFGVMSQCAAMLGNTSSGIIEAPIFRVPVVNVGTRQDGRVRASNIIDCRSVAEDIVVAVRKALRPDFRIRLRDMEIPFYKPDGVKVALEAILQGLENPQLMSKQFVDLEYSFALNEQPN